MIKVCSIHPNVAVHCCESTECHICWSRWRRRVESGQVPKGLQSRFYDFDIDMAVEEARLDHIAAEERLDAATSECDRAEARREMEAAVKKREQAIKKAFDDQRKCLESEERRKRQKLEDEAAHLAWLSHNSSEAETKGRLRKYGVVFPEDQ